MGNRQHIAACQAVLGLVIGAVAWGTAPDSKTPKLFRPQSRRFRRT